MTGRLNMTIVSVYIGNLSRYAECYPGLAEMDDAIGDSDDEADFSKMDMGNKKGPVGRFGMETIFLYHSVASLVKVGL